MDAVYVVSAIYSVKKVLYTCKGFSDRLLTDDNSSFIISRVVVCKRVKQDEL